MPLGLTRLLGTEWASPMWVTCRLDLLHLSGVACTSFLPANSRWWGCFTRCYHNERNGSWVPKDQVEESPSPTGEMTSLLSVLKCLSVFVPTAYPLLTRIGLYWIPYACLMSQYVPYSKPGSNPVPSVQLSLILSSWSEWSLPDWISPANLLAIKGSKPSICRLAGHQNKKGTWIVTQSYFQ